MAEDLWRRLDAMDFINQGMLFAATLLLCFFPFLIVASEQCRPTGVAQSGSAQPVNDIALRPTRRSTP